MGLYNMTDSWGVTNNVLLRLVSVDDARFILDLRLDNKKNRYLSPIESSEEKQREWLRAYKDRESAGLEYYFMILDKDHSSLGMVRLYDIREDSFCWGSWLLREFAPKYAAIESALNLYYFGFEVCGFSHSHFDVRKGNDSVVNFHQRFGAEIVRENDLDYFFDLSIEKYFLAKKRYKKFLLGLLAKHPSQSD